mgnify:FL=1
MTVTTEAVALSVYSVASGIALTFAAMAARLAWRRRHVPGGLFLGVNMLGAAVWVACAVAEVCSTSTAAILLSAKHRYLGIAVTAPSWLLFALGYAGFWPSQRKLRALVLGMLAIIPFVTVVFVFAAPDCPYMWSAIYPSAPGIGQPLLVEHGPWFTVWAAYSFSCTLGGAVVLLSSVVRRRGVAFLSQIVILIGAVLIPTGASILRLLKGDVLGGIDLTPAAIAACGALVWLGLSRHNVLCTTPALVPMANATMLRDMRDVVVVTDQRWAVVAANLSAERILGRSQKALVGESVFDLFAGIKQMVASAGGAERNTVPIQTMITDVSGSKRWLEIVASPIGNGGNPIGRVLVMRDITLRKRLEEKLIHSSLHDQLTGLPNRPAVRSLIAQLLDESTPTCATQPLSVLALNLTRFRVINGTLGYEAGNIVLRQFADRLTANAGGAIYPARLEGDRFAVVLAGQDEVASLSTAGLLREQLAEPFHVGGQQVLLSVSIGIATSPQHGSDAEELLRRAEVACSAAREDIQRLRVYRADTDSDTRERLALVADLQTAIREGSLELHYQPQIDAVSGRLVRVEALARWQRSDGEMIPPSEFIPLAEQNGWLPLLTQWALDAALHTFGGKGGQGSGVGVAVNLSAISLRDPTLPSVVEKSLRRAGVSSVGLWLEITETSVMRDPEQARRVLEAMRGLGVRLAIDDFGTGYSSLSYMSQLPVSDVKIDRSFVRDVNTRRDHRAIIRSTTTLAHELGLTVTIEGVETAEEFACARELGCDCIQGFYVGPPMPADDLERWAFSRYSATDYWPDRSRQREHYLRHHAERCAGPGPTSSGLASTPTGTQPGPGKGPQAGHHVPGAPHRPHPGAA